MYTYQLTINPVIRAAIAPLRHEEYEMLEQSIVREGCRDSLVLWGDTLIDGHNRYEICTKHGIDFSTTAMDFADVDTAIAWVEETQLGRRNLTDEQYAALRGSLWRRLERRAGRPENNGVTVAH